MRAGSFLLYIAALFFVLFSILIIFRCTASTESQIRQYDVLFVDRTYLLESPQEVWATWKDEWKNRDGGPIEWPNWMEYFSFITIQADGMENNEKMGVFSSGTRPNSPQ